MFPGTGGECEASDGSGRGAILYGSVVISAKLLAFTCQCGPITMTPVPHVLKLS